MSSLLYEDSHKISEKIAIKVPHVGEILENEDAYYDAVCSIVATPYEMMVQLDDNGIDFTKISQFELFCLMMRHLKEIDTSMIFEGFDLSTFDTAINQSTGDMVVIDREKDIVIDKALHQQICNFLRKMLSMDKNDKKPGNEEAKKYMIDKERRKQKRRKNKKHDSTLEKYIIALVNTSEFKYDYSSVKDISIYQFYMSLRQISRKIQFDNTMIGCYAGTVKFDELDKNEKSWIQLD